MRLILLLSCASLSGCLFLDDGGSSGGDGDDVTDPADAAPQPSSDAGPEPDRFDCVADQAEESHPVTVSGTVLDHATGEPIAGAEVAVGSAWYVGGGFPDECPPVATLTTGEDGTFGPAPVDVRAPTYFPAYIIFMVTGDGLAPTASDQTLACDESGCSPIDHAVAVPSRELADGWRQELERGGMQDATTRGLVLFTFKNPDRSPAEGVVLWNGIIDEESLDPDTEVRFLEADATTVAAPGTIATTASGLALIGLGAELEDEYDTDFISGTRVADRWEETGVLHDPGWIFVEDKQQDP